MMGEIAPKSNGGFSPILRQKNVNTVVGQLPGQSSLLIGSSSAPAVNAITIGDRSRNGQDSSIVIGQACVVTGGASGIAIGGGVNLAASTNSIAIGTTSTANADSAIAVGANAKSTGSGDIIIGTGNGTNTSGGAIIAIGRGNTQPSSIGSHAMILGFMNTGSAFGTYSLSLGDSHINTFGGATVIGKFGRSDFINEITFATSGFSTYGDMKSSIALMLIQTTDATVTELGVGSSNSLAATTNRIALTDLSTYLFDCDIVARNTVTATESAVWNLKFGIRRGSGVATTALIGTPTKTIYGQDTGTTTWDVNVTADTTNGRPNISVTGQAAKTIRWVANIRITKVTN